MTSWMHSDSSLSVFTVLVHVVIYITFRTIIRKLSFADPATSHRQRMVDKKGHLAAKYRYSRKEDALKTTEKN